MNSGNKKYDSRNACNAIIETTSNNLIIGCKNTIIPSTVTKIGDKAFYYCEGLTNITIPNSVTNIGSNAFEKCNSLTSITIPNSVTNIDVRAFAECSKLLNITIGNSVTTIEDAAFYGCKELVSIEIPNSVKTIGDDAFRGCSSLVNAVIGNSVEFIGGYAFSDCEKFTDIYCYSTKVPSTSNYAFENSYPEYMTLHVPAVAINSYQTTKPWSNFGTIKVLDGFSVNKYLLTYKVDGEIYATDSIKFGATITPIAPPTKEGHTFSGWSEIPETMPANDIVVEGSFSINSYTVTFMVDGEVYETVTVEYGAEIELPTPPEKEGYIFTGWIGVPATMPAEDIVIEGRFEVDTTGINTVKLDLEKNEVYNLKGQRITESENLTRGIYIVNGRKVLIK